MNPEVEFSSLFRFIRNGMNVKQEKEPNGIPITRIETISNGRIDPQRVGYAGLVKGDCSRWLLEVGDILFSHINSPEMVGKCALYRGAPAQLVHGMNLLCLRPDRKKLHPDFMVYLLRTPEFRNNIAPFINKAVNQASISIGNLSTILIRIPPLDDQMRIAAILDQADDLKQKRRQTLRQLEALSRAIYLEMFGDPALNPMGWIRKTIGEIGRVITGNTPSRANASYYGNSIEWIKSDNLNTPHYYLTKAREGLSLAGKAVARTAPVNSILVTCIAGTPDCIGNAALADREIAFNQQINAFIPHGGNAHFFYAQIIVGKKLIQQASTQGMKGLVSKSRFESVSLTVPPEASQHEFARRILSIEDVKSAHSRSLARLDALFASLQYRAFTGSMTVKAAERELAEAV